MPSFSTFVFLSLALLHTTTATLFTGLDHPTRGIKFIRRSSRAPRRPRVIASNYGPAIPKRRLTDLLSTRATAASLFAPLDYAAGQISDGVAGNAEAEANAVCVTPFANVNLATVSSTDLSNLDTFREAAETAETAQFDPEIAAASGAAATALQNGKIKNKVLKLTCEVQSLLIKQAQRSDEASDITTEQTKLATNIALDKAAAGQPSEGVTGGIASVASSSTSAAAIASTSTSAAVASVATQANVASTGTSLFAPLAYAQGQISDGVAGNAQAQANAVCVTPFANVDLATVSQTDLDNLETFREAAETAETAQFDPAIAAATGAAATALQNGKIKNKVLKLTCFAQVLQIKQAQGQDTAAQITNDEGLLATNIAWIRRRLDKYPKVLCRFQRSEGYTLSRL